MKLNENMELITMKPKLSVSDVKDFGGAKFSIRLEVETGDPEILLSQTQIVSAGERDAAVQIAQNAFLQWLDMVFEQAVKNMPDRMRN